ncbi:hypothetical protein WR25_26399 [Diploscapter pachys]|uniref:Uncharacterized protein n=1 Tax=Diploscapter pachys TaxID=2018661 RepID=A0A2A2M2D0_9BILA|nr:hypothetical protein WR25_26399 [Diploscapter pachys]
MPAGLHQGQRAAVVVVPDPVDPHLALQHRRQRVLRRIGIALHADAPAAAMAGHLRRIDAEQADPFGPAFDSVAVDRVAGDGQRHPGKRDQRRHGLPTTLIAPTTRPSTSNVPSSLSTSTTMSRAVATHDVHAVARAVRAGVDQHAVAVAELGFLAVADDRHQLEVLGIAELGEPGAGERPIAHRLLPIETEASGAGRDLDVEFRHAQHVAVVGRDMAVAHLAAAEQQPVQADLQRRGDRDHRLGLDEALATVAVERADRDACRMRQPGIIAVAQRCCDAVLHRLMINIDGHAAFSRRIFGIAHRSC